jgi:hypothetical protein
MTTKAAITTPVEQRSARFKGALQLLRATLAEIFDESAYQRFLTRSELNSSRASYAMFVKEQEIRKARQPKCC